MKRKCCLPGKRSAVQRQVFHRQSASFVHPLPVIFILKSKDCTSFLSKSQYQIKGKEENNMETSDRFDGNRKDVLLTARSLKALRWIAEQEAVSRDHISQLLGTTPSRRQMNQASYRQGRQIKSLNNGFCSAWLGDSASSP
jgi:hypothetical protein